MNISQVAQKSGLPPKTIRYYEGIGLLKPVQGANGYRSFSDTYMHKLAFLGRARALAQDHLSRIEDKIADLVAMRDTLGTLVKSCAGDARADCLILSNLGDTT